MIVDQIDVERIPFKAENDPPIGLHPHRPVALQVAFQGMEPVARDAHVFNLLCRIQTAEDRADAVQQIGANPADVATFVEPFQSLCRRLSIMLNCNL